MGDFLKGVLVTLLVIGYVIMPDLFPGPIDDLIIIVLAITGTISKKKQLD